MKKKTYNIKYVAYDSWNRPVFKLFSINGITENVPKMYFGSTHFLLPDRTIAPNGTVPEINDFFRENIDSLEYFGNHFDCEPEGRLNPEIELNILD